MITILIQYDRIWIAQNPPLHRSMLAHRELF